MTIRFSSRANGLASGLVTQLYWESLVCHKELLNNNLTYTSTLLGSRLVTLAGTSRVTGRKSLIRPGLAGALFPR